MALEEKTTSLEGVRLVTKTTRSVHLGDLLDHLSVIQNNGELTPGEQAVITDAMAAVRMIYNGELELRRVPPTPPKYDSETNLGDILNAALKEQQALRATTPQIHKIAMIKGLRKFCTFPQFQIKENGTLGLSLKTAKDAVEFMLQEHEMYLRENLRRVMLT